MTPPELEHTAKTKDIDSSVQFGKQAVTVLGISEKVIARLSAAKIVNLNDFAAAQQSTLIEAFGSKAEYQRAVSELGILTHAHDTKNALTELLRNARLLLIQDGETDGSALRGLLSLADCKVDAVADLAESQLVEWRLQVGYYDAILCELKTLGDRLEGFLKLLRKHSAIDSLIGLCDVGYDPNHSVVHARRAGMRRLLYVPFRADQLCKTLSSIFKRRRLRRQNERSGTDDFHSYLRHTSGVNNPFLAQAIKTLDVASDIELNDAMSPDFRRRIASLLTEEIRLQLAELIQVPLTINADATLPALMHAGISSEKAQSADARFVEVLKNTSAKQIGAVLRKRRREKGLTQDEVAKLANQYKQSVSDHERGTHKPHLQTLILYCVALQLAPRDFLESP